jgi:hypothetical protein
MENNFIYSSLLEFTDHRASPGHVQSKFCVFFSFGCGWLLKDWEFGEKLSRN